MDSMEVGSLQGEKMLDLVKCIVDQCALDVVDLSLASLLNGHHLCSRDSWNLCPSPRRD